MYEGVYHVQLGDLRYAVVTGLQDEEFATETYADQISARIPIPDGRGVRMGDS